MTELDDRILGHLRASPLRAAFLTELIGLAAGDRDGKVAIEAALAGLEQDGRVLVRAHFCADPHLSAVDLRVAALVDAAGAAGGDPIDAAVKRDQAVWEDWITAFLRNHRCQ